jgi:hypothetical protein
VIAVLARSAATVAIAAGLVFVVPGGPVQAAGEAGLIEKAAQVGVKLVASDGLLVKGAVTAAVPEAVLACTGPQVAVCAGVGVVVAGAVLYATKDTWIPWVQTAFGVGGAGSTQNGGIQMSLTWAPTFAPTLNGAQVLVHYENGSNFLIAKGFYGQFQCKSSAGTYSAIYNVANNGGNWPGAPDYRASGNSLMGTCGADAALSSATVWFGGGGVSVSNTITWGAPFNPATDSTVKTTVDCTLADGTTGQVSVVTVNPDGGVLVPSCVAAFGPGAHGTKIALNGGQTGAPQQPLSTISVPTTSTLYPNCVGAGVACTYVVKYQGSPCIVGQVECIDWAWQSQVDGQTDYQCFYGPYALPIGGCALNERAYETTPSRLTKLNTDGNPLTWDGLKPSWLPDGALGTGLAPLPAPGPVAPPAGAPGGAPAPIPPPAAGPGPLPAPGPAAPNESTDCWPNGAAAWNPAEWVLRPVKCALSWAFVPSSSYITSWGDSINAAWTGSPFGTWMNTLGGLGNIPIVNAGCAGPSLSTGFLSGLPGNPLPATIHPFDACSAPMSTVAATSNLVLSAGIAFYGGMKVVRQLGYAFGFKIDIGSERSTFT